MPELPRLQSDAFLLKKMKLSGWVPLSQIAPLAVQAVITSEDDDFYQHKGYELDSIEKALKTDLKSFRFKRGASTITQQVMKNTLLTRRKFLRRKIEEIILARDAEKILTKDRILEIYLNTAQFGEEIYGIEAASAFYFQKKAADLNLKEGAFLAMLLPSPIRYSQSFRDHELTAYARQTIVSILRRMAASEKITDLQRQTAEESPLSFESPIPSDAPTIGVSATSQAFPVVELTPVSTTFSH